MGRTKGLGNRTAARSGLVRGLTRSAICAGVLSTALTFVVGTTATASPYETDAQFEEPAPHTELSSDVDVGTLDVVSAAMPAGSAGGRTPGSLAGHEFRCRGSRGPDGGGGRGPAPEAM